MINLATLTNLFLLVIVYVCAVTALSDEDIEKMLNGQDSDDIIEDFRGYPDMDDIGELKDRLNTLENLNNEANEVFGSVDSASIDKGVRKRPFCNGFTGCGRLHGKRSASSLLEKLVLSDSKAPQATPSVAKRPFCNGFFGCGNPGKRIVFRNANLVNQNGYGNLEQRTADKRFFCNQGAFGCRNPDKRSPYRAWFENMRSKLAAKGMPQFK